MAFEFSACDYEEMKWGTFSVVGLYAGDVIMAVNSSGKEASIRKVAKGGLIGCVLWRVACMVWDARAGGARFFV